MRILVSAMLTVFLTGGASAQATEPQGACLADGTPPAQKLEACSSVITSAPPTDPRALASLYINRGNAYLGKEDYSHALADFDAATKLDPGNPGAFIGRGRAALHDNQYDRAIQNFDKATKLNPRSDVAWSDLGDAYRQKGRYDSALQDYNNAIGINPNLVEAYVGRALTFQGKVRYDFDAYLQEGHFESLAIADYTKALELDPKAILYHVNRGQLYLAVHKNDLAIADLTEAVERAPGSFFFLKARADAYRVTRQYDLAIADYRKGLTLKSLPAFMRPQFEQGLKDLGATP